MNSMSRYTAQIDNPRIRAYMPIYKMLEYTLPFIKFSICAFKILHYAPRKAITNSESLENPLGNGIIHQPTQYLRGMLRSSGQNFNTHSRIQLVSTH